MENAIKVRFVDLGREYSDLKKEILSKFDELSSKGDYILSNDLKLFEENLARFCGTKYAIGVGNCADALFLCLKALGIKGGDEVITAPNSFIASAGAIAATGAKPVFVDVGYDFNINPELLEKAITPRTKAILPVHFTGRPADMEPILKIAKKHGLAVVEDAAQAIGAEYKGKRIGSFGIANCFSLHPLKNLHVHGDGGAITTDDFSMYQKLIKLRNHGLKNRDECEFWGYNSRLDGIQAAIANIKLKHIDAWTDRIREIAGMYSEGLDGVVRCPLDNDGEKQVFQMYMIICENRDQLQKYLLECGIEAKVHYPIPIHLQEAAKSLGYKVGDFPVCEDLSRRILSLPIYPCLSDQQVQSVISSIRKFYKQ